MSDIKITGGARIKNALNPGSAGKREGNGFDSLLNDAIAKVNDVQKQAESAIHEIASGGDITNAVITMEKANMSFQTMIEVRNKLLSAYEEIMRMQI